MVEKSPLVDNYEELLEEKAKEYGRRLLKNMEEIGIVKKVTIEGVDYWIPALVKPATGIKWRDKDKQDADVRSGDFQKRVRNSMRSKA